MTSGEILTALFSSVTYSPSELVFFAEIGKGYVGDDGAYGVWYLDPLDSKEPSARKLEIRCWTCGDDSVELSLGEYLNALKEFLLSKGEMSLIKRVEKIQF